MADAKELAIIKEIRNGDQEGYRFIVERYHLGLVQHVYNLTHDAQQAEDIAQDAFIRAYDKLSQYNEAYAFSTWLYKIANNLAYRELERRKPSQDIDELQEILPDDKPSLAEVTDTVFAKEAVRKAVDTLPLAFQQVINLYYWDNFSYEEIAAIMDRPVGTIRTWLYRAKELLRKDLHGQV